MTRVNKKNRLKKCPRKPKYGFTKTGPKIDLLTKGFKEHINLFIGDISEGIFIPKIK